MDGRIVGARLELLIDCVVVVAAASVVAVVVVCPTKCEIQSHVDCINYLWNCCQFLPIIKSIFTGNMTKLLKLNAWSSGWM